MACLAPTIVIGIMAAGYAFERAGVLRKEKLASERFYSGKGMAAIAAMAYLSMA